MRGIGEIASSRGAPGSTMHTIRDLTNRTSNATAYHSVIEQVVAALLCCPVALSLSCHTPSARLKHIRGLFEAHPRIA